MATIEISEHAEWNFSKARLLSLRLDLAVTDWISATGISRSTMNTMEAAGQLSAVSG